jgi:hypothetical protein
MVEVGGEMRRDEADHDEARMMTMGSPNMETSDQGDPIFFQWRRQGINSLHYLQRMSYARLQN